MKKSEARSQKSEVKLSNLFVPGFKAAGIACGIKKNGNKDLALIYSEVPAVAAAVFTTNKIKAAPVLIDIQRIKKGLCQAVIINSGNANACTGKKGLDAAVKTVTLLEKELGIKKGLVMVSSTGVIGEPLPIDKIEKGISTLNSQLSTLNAAYGWGNAAEAIMTTDAFPKIAFEKGKIGGKDVSVLGIAKGAGMIAPNMATMLSFIVTDASVDKNTLQKALKNVVDNSFNCVTVDGDTSTNDTVLLLANGFAGNRKFGVRSSEFGVFLRMLEKVCQRLAKMIVIDGEGATKLLEFNVSGAKTDADAKKVAETVANSPLVKTAFFGEDANWGRIMAAIGRSGICVEEYKIKIYFNDVPVVLKGVDAGREQEAAKTVKKDNICVRIELGLGKGKKTVWASDLSYDYVKINAAYRT